MQLSLVTRLLDIGLLVAMALLPATASAQSRATMITLHLFRTSMANCTRPLMRSLMMDNVPKRHRGEGNIHICALACRQSKLVSCCFQGRAGQDCSLSALLAPKG